MGSQRRNRITRTDSLIAAGVAAVAGVIACFAGCEPTGNAVPDAILTFSLAAVVTWLGASTPWWALFTGAMAASVAALGGGPFLLVLVAWVAAAVAGTIGELRLNQPILRAACAAAIVQVVLRLEWSPFFLASALVAGAILVLIAVTGWQRRRGHVRRAVMWSTVAVAAVAVLATAAFGVSALRIRSSASEGYRDMLLALDLLESGELDEAPDALATASAGLSEAADGVDGVLSQPARLVPVVAQNRDITADVLRRAAAAADAAGTALSTVDLDRLNIVDGRIDVAALAEVEPALAELESTVLELREVLDATESPYLVGPLASRLDNARERADQVAVHAVASHAAARVGPAILGADEPRRYLIAFTNPAEARAQSGLMGNWSEVTISDGRIEVTRSGRTAELERGIDQAPPIFLDQPEEYLLHYGQYGAGAPGEPVRRKFWGNALVSPDTRSVGEVYAQLYEATMGRALDGVVVMDPTAIAGLLDLTGPIDVPGTDLRLSDANAVEFLTRGQYEFAENEREDFLEAITALTIDQLLTSTLPPPQALGATLGPAATEGHLSAWAARPEEQRLLELVGMDATMPRLDELPQSDALAVTVNNASGNKIDSFLEREIEYRPIVDEDAGIVSAELSVRLTNTAPSSGYNDYVIGNLVGLPTGTNRLIAEIWSALTITEVAIDDRPVAVTTLDELGWNIQQIGVDIPPGQTITITATLSGRIEPGDYELIWRPQPLPNPDRVVIEATRNGGGKIVDFDGQLLRRTLVTAEASDAWRPDDHPAR